jgi:hypothetical protein
MKRSFQRAGVFLLVLLSQLAVTAIVVHVDSAQASYPIGITQKIRATRGWYGDQSDGTDSGVGCTVSSGTTSLSRDIFCSTLTVDSGASLNTNGFRVFADIAIVNGDAGMVGNAASSGTGGGATSAGSLGTGTAGGNGGTSGSGSGTTGTNQAVTVYGNLGGEGGNGGNTNGTDGSVSGGINSLAAGYGGARFSPASIYGYVVGVSGVATVAGGTGGGGGAWDAGADSGGGSGGGCGVVMISARSLQGSGLIECKGGAGAAATATDAGGGGGGGGGVIFLNVGDYTLWSGSTSVAGGVAGAEAGTGDAGDAGDAGDVVTLWM